jgi:hypothetical protein
LIQKKDKEKDKAAKAEAGERTKGITITEKLRQKMAAIVLVEAYEGQEEDIAWIYYNMITAKGQEGLRQSSAYKYKSDWFKIWLVTLVDKTYAPDKPPPKTKDVTKYKTIGDYVKKHGWFVKYGPPRAKRAVKILDRMFKDPAKNPYKGWEGQGSLDDLNRNDVPWNQARQYLFLQKEGKVTETYIKELPADKKEYTSFIFHREAILKYFKEHPEMLGKNVKKYCIGGSDHGK